MGLQIGDKVKFLNEEGGGEITQLIDTDTVMVLSDMDDFEIPVLISEIISLSENKGAKKEIVSSNPLGMRSGILCGVFAVFASEVETHNLYLINATPSALMVGVFEEGKTKITGVFSGILQADSVQKISNYSLKDFEAISQWKVQGFYFERYPKEITAPLNCMVKVHPKKLFNGGNKKFIEEIGQEGILIPLEQNKQEKSLKPDDLFADSSMASKAPPKERRKDSRELLEVDLHIHELLETTSGMSNGEMLEYQLDTFHKVLDSNKKYKGKRIVFIHGVGNGVLKQRIRHYLQKYPRYVVQDASFQEYGWGATMVIIK